MERVKLRHREAEELILKAREQAKERERQRQLLRAKGRSIPPEATLLGCWQLIELTILANADPSRFPTLIMGTHQLFFTTLTPDRRILGTQVRTGDSFYIPGTNRIQEKTGVQTSDIDGRILGEGLVTYRLTPARNRMTFASGRLFVSLPMDCNARWQGWELEGEATGKGTRQGFKAVRIEDSAFKAVGYALSS